MPLLSRLGFLFAPVSCVCESALPSRSRLLAAAAPQLELTWEERSGLNTSRTNAQPHHSMFPSPTCDGEGHGSSQSFPDKGGKEHLYVQNIIKFLLKFKSKKTRYMYLQFPKRFNV